MNSACHCEHRSEGRGNPSEFQLDGHVASLLAMTDLVHCACLLSANALRLSSRCVSLHPFLAYEPTKLLQSGLKICKILRHSRYLTPSCAASFTFCCSASFSSPSLSWCVRGFWRARIQGVRSTPRCAKLSIRTTRPNSARLTQTSFETSTRTRTAHRQDCSTSCALLATAKRCRNSGRK